MPSSSLFTQSVAERLKVRRLLVYGPFLALGLVLVVLWALVLWFALIYPRSLVEDLQQDLHGIALNAAQDTEQLLRETEGSLRTIDLLLMTRKTDRHDLDATVSLLADSLRDNSRGLTDVMLAATDGRLWRIPSVTGEPYVDLGPKSFLSELGKPGGPSIVIGRPLQLRPGAHLVVPMATRLSAPAGPFTATVGFIDIDVLQRIYRARTMRAGTAILLERDDGIAMARWPEVQGLIGTNLRALPGGDAMPPDPPASGQFIVAESPADGLERIVSYRVLQDYPMRLYVSFERDRILAGYLQQRRAVLGFSMLISVIAIGLMAWFTRIQQRTRLREAEREATADASPMGLFRCDLNGRTVYANETYLRMLEVDRHDLAWGWLDRLPSTERELTREQWGVLAARGEPVDRVRQLTRRDGTELLVRLRMRPMRLGGRIVAHAGTIADISAELAARRERERSQAVMGAMAQSVNVMMLAVDTDERVLFCNKAFERRFDIPERSWHGRQASEVFDDLYPAVRPLIRRAFAGETSVVEMRDDDGVSRPMPLDGEDRGETRYVELTYAPLLNDDGAIIGAYGVARDVTDAKQEQMRLLRASNTDPLTELLNRAGFASEVGAALRRADDRDELVALLYLDLDRFKPVNDEYGHPVGDALLKAVAGRIRHALRPQDLVARVGGDEFAVFLTHVAKPADAQVVADKLVHALTMPFRIGALELHIGTSVGYCVRWARGATLDDLVEQADDHLYRAKRAGRGQSSGTLCADRASRPGVDRG
ncbi:diguanylate cyclase [Mitsuaria sp. GD03876]|uniref:bifunctional diguanylate cyclase/phosphodiesterase n=1 Tax=Mitsuaria sp. GD03876 TaxID=2975399 RepID=UPI00244B4B4D|nr:diguanylate cyclase [Mitsuaria sp. GD03876]MDH0866849.1 diguanylate cyclase [Mitsuaria sp. GD03876]